MTGQVSSSFTWYSPTKVFFGVGSRAKLASVVDDTAGSRAHVFLVTGRRSLRAHGITQRVMESLGPGRVTLFDEVTPFPSPELVGRALDACRRSLAEVVVAVGGGSPMDVAKSVAILTMHDGSPLDFATGRKELQTAGLPFIAVPTTSGSSSEVTSGAALWDMEARRSMALASPLMFPSAAIVDPELALTMPKPLAAASGMDAFTSAFESYWSLDSEPIADALNLDVIRTFATNLERSCQEGDLGSRSACALAATVSGIAYSNSHPNVCHAVGSPLTIFWGADHGQAVGITLSTFLRWNAPAIQHKLPPLWEALGVAGLDEATARIDLLLESCDLETRLRGLGMRKADMATLVENIRWDRTDIVPRPLDRRDAQELLGRLW